MRSLIFIVLLALTTLIVPAQEYVGRSNDAAFFIDKVKRDKMTVTFVGIAAPYSIHGGQLEVDENNVLYTSFSANCLSMEYYWTANWGVSHGKPFKSTKQGEKTVAEKPQMVFWAIDAACRQETVSS